MSASRFRHGNGLAPGAPVSPLATVARVACAFALLAALPASLRADDPVTTKSTMIWNIAKFIKWPAAAFENGNGDFVFTILGEDSLAEALAANMSTRTLATRPVFVRVVGRPQDVTGSQIVYVATSARARLPEVLRLLHNGPVLTLADSPGFIADGGMVDFTLERDGQVRFEIHQVRTEKAGLKVSAKLLAIAHVVESDAAATK